MAPQMPIEVINVQQSFAGIILEHRKAPGDTVRTEYSDLYPALCAAQAMLRPEWQTNAGNC